MAILPFLRRKNDQRTDCDPRPAEHGPAARRRVNTYARLDLAQVLAAEAVRQQLRRELAEGLEELRREFRKEQDLRRSRYGGISRVLGHHSLDIGQLAERVIRLEHPEPDGDPCEGDTSSAARLRLVPSPRIPDLQDRAA